MYRLPNYKRATNAAYEVLQKQANISLPIDIEFVAKQYPNIRLKKYSEVARKFGLTMAEYLEIAPSEFGFVKKKVLMPLFYIMIQKELRPIVLP